MNKALKAKRNFRREMLLSFAFVFLSFFTYAQKITTSIDSLSIKIGQELKYIIEVDVDTSSLVVFPEGHPEFFTSENDKFKNTTSILFGVFVTLFVGQGVYQGYKQNEKRLKKEG